MGIFKMKTINLFFGVSIAQYDYTNYDSSVYGSDSYSDSYYGGSIDDWKSDSYGSYESYSSIDPNYFDIYSDENASEENQENDAPSVLDLFANVSEESSSSESQSEDDYGSSESSIMTAPVEDSSVMQLDVYDDIYLDEEEEVEEAEEEEETEEEAPESLLDAIGARYFAPIPVTTVSTTAATATTAATTTVASSTSWKCWHCDESSLTDCSNNGAEKECHSGDYGSCMTEVTEENGTMRNICMGCKQADACQRAKAENFWDYLNDPVVAAARDASPVYDRFTKCKPETAYNSNNQRSYCRQCCYTSNCFSTAGYTDKTGTVTPWSTVIQWPRA